MTNSGHHITTIHDSGDGSHTLYSQQFNQFFHNPNGAIAESRHIFFNTPGLAKRLKTRKHFNIFEAGFGSGLNLLVLVETLGAMEHPPDVSFRSVEAYPISSAQARALNHAAQLNLPDPGNPLPEIFDRLKPGLNQFQIGSRLQLDLFKGPFHEMPASPHPFDAIFFDPFSPDANPDFWRPDVFKRLADESHPEVILSTYCAASVARAAMAIGGWAPYRLPGALGKREMTVAVRSGNRFPHGIAVDAERLIERYRRGDLELP